MAENKMPSIDPDDLKRGRSPELEGAKDAGNRNVPLSDVNEDRDSDGAPHRDGGIHHERGGRRTNTDD
jgi:hypothetical protein